MAEEFELDDTSRLDDDSYLSKNFTPGYHDIHVLVALPKATNPIGEDTPSRPASIHSQKRLERWHELNKILDNNSHKKPKTKGEGGTSTGYSYVRWSEVKNVLAYDRYEQERVSIPDDRFQFLLEYLKYAASAMNGYTDATREAKRYHFIAPILIMLCSLFGDVKLEVEETVVGNEVNGTGHFEFVLTRGKKKICIVEAKRNDFDQGKAQALVGCEAVADHDGLFVVYGIVTDFIKWQLFRCGENAISMDSSTLSVKSDVLQVDSIRDVCEMIYGALLGHEEICKKEKSVCVDVAASE